MFVQACNEVIMGDDQGSHMHLELTTHLAHMTMNLNQRDVRKVEMMDNRLTTLWMAALL